MPITTRARPTISSWRQLRHPRRQSLGWTRCRQRRCIGLNAPRSASTSQPASQIFQYRPIRSPLQPEMHVDCRTMNPACPTRIDQYRRQHCHQYVSTRREHAHLVSQLLHRLSSCCARAGHSILWSFSRACSPRHRRFWRCRGRQPFSFPACHRYPRFTRICSHRLANSNQCRQHNTCAAAPSPPRHSAALTHCACH